MADRKIRYQVTRRLETDDDGFLSRLGARLAGYEHLFAIVAVGLVLLLVAAQIPFAIARQHAREFVGP